jgi:F-type H+-transporting ATPase subunit c
MKMYRDITLALLTVLSAVPALAEQTAAATVTASAGAGYSLGLAALAVGIMMGAAVIGGTMGQGRAAAAAVEGISRNPAAQNKIFIPLLLALALMESLVLFAFLIGNNMGGAITEAIKNLR